MDTILIAGSSAAGQLVLMVAAPMLARTYGPTEIGLYAVFTSVTAIIVAVSCMRYEMAIPVVSHEDIPTAVMVSFAASLLMSLIVALLVPSHLLVSGTPFNELGLRLWLLPLITVLGGLAQIGTYLSIRFAKFRVNALYKFSQPALFVSLALLLPAIGLPAAYVLSFGCALMFVYFYRGNMPSTMHGSFVFAREHRHYTLALMPTAVMDAAATALPMIFIGTFYGAASAGNFSMVQRLAVGPLLLLSAAVNQVFFGECSRRVRDGHATTPMLIKSLSLLGILVIAWLLMLLFVGDRLLAKALGVGWSTDISYIFLVIAPFIVRVIVSPLSTLLIAVNSKRKLFYWQAAYFISCVTVLAWGATRFDNLAFLKLYAAHETLFYLIYLSLIYGASKKYSLILREKQLEMPCL